MKPKKSYRLTWGEGFSQLEPTKKDALYVASKLLNDGFSVKISVVKL